MVIVVPAFFKLIRSQGIFPGNGIYKVHKFLILQVPIPVIAACLVILTTSPGIEILIKLNN